MVEKGKLSKDNYIWMLDAAGGHNPLKMLSRFFQFPETAVNKDTKQNYAKFQVLTAASMKMMIYRVVSYK
jgi:hypothetical protein